MVIDKIVAEMGQMSPVNQKIAQFVIKNKDEVGFFSISEFSDRVGTSQASLVRFAKKLGFSGFNNFKKAVQEEIRKRLSPFDKILFSDLGLLPKENQFKKLFENELANLKKTFAELDIRVIMKIIEGVESAQRLYVCGFGGNAFMAGKFVHSLQTVMDKHIELISGAISDFTPRIASLAKGDVVFVLTFPPYSKENLYIAELAKERGAKFYLFTDSAQCPVYETADAFIFCQNNTLILANSYVSILGMLQVLVDMIFLYFREEGLRTVKKINEIESAGNEKFRFIKNEKK